MWEETYKIRGQFLSEQENTRNLCNLYLKEKSLEESRRNGVFVTD